MSHQPHRILVVAPTLSVARKLFAGLHDRGFDLEIVSSFTAAKTRLAGAPDLLLTEVKLGEFNGLHLAVRALAAGVPALVLGDPDVGLERDAQQLGAAYLIASAISSDEIAIVVEKLLASASADPYTDAEDREVVTERHAAAVTCVFPSRVGFTSPVAARASSRLRSPVLH